MTEDQMFLKLKNNLGPIIDFFNIETGATETSIPDVYYDMFGNHGWIELKQLSNWKKLQSINIPYRPGQRQWLKKRKSGKINVFILLFIDSRFILLNKFNKSFETIFELEEKALWIGNNFLDKEFLSILAGNYER